MLILHHLDLERKNSGMLAGNVPLDDQIVEFFHGAFATIKYPSTRCKHVQVIVRRMSFAATILARHSLPAPTTVMSFRSAVDAVFIHRDAIRTANQTLRTRICARISQFCRANEVAATNSFRGSSSLSDPMKSESDTLSLIAH